MSPEMLTLVAVVLAYETPREICDPRSVFVLEILEICEPARSGRSLSLKVRSETRVEKDMAAVEVCCCSDVANGYRDDRKSMTCSALE
jgi:hypothetical protein